MKTEYTKSKLLAFLLTSVLASSVCADADGTLDTKFAAGSASGAIIEGLLSTDVLSIALQDDGKIIVGGTRWHDMSLGVIREGIFRLNVNGSLDHSFDSGSGADRVVTMAIQPDGKILIGGTFTGYNGTAINRIARLNSDGSLDTSFNVGAGANNVVQSLAVQADGKIIVGGAFKFFNGVSANSMARLNPDGSLDTGFNVGAGAAGGAANVQVLVIQPDGKIIIGGTFTSFNGVPNTRAARLNADGSLDSSFNIGTGFDSNVNAIVVQPDGKILFGGLFHIVNGTPRNGIARINQNGSLDNSFDPGSIEIVRPVQSIALQSDGKIIVGLGRGAAKGVARMNTDGSPDTSFYTGTSSDGGARGSLQYGAVNAVAIQLDGKIIIGGSFNRYNYVSRSNIARIHGTDIDACVKNDYIRKGMAGWIWKGQSNGVETQSQIWQLTYPFYSKNWAVPDRTYPPAFADQPNWEVVTVGSFNKCGDVDILWRHKSTAQWKVWQMQHGTRVAQNDLPDFDLAHEWQVIGAGDTDKDGDDDVILNNANTGAVIIWEMKNHTTEGVHNIGAKPGYVLKRIGDFNKDIDVDLLFRQVDGDALVIWEIENNALVTERVLANAGAGYNPVCAADFDRDGDDDILLIHGTTMQEKWFVMENYTRTQKFGGNNDGFVFLGCGDYDADGDADSLWQRSSDDMNRIVLQQNWGATKQTVYTNAFGGENPGAPGYGFKYRNNNN